MKDAREIAVEVWDAWEREDDSGRALMDRYAAAIEQARAEGMEEGIRLYAWWRDGVQYVGTTGKTLKEAIAAIRAAKGKGGGE